MGPGQSEPPSHQAVRFRSASGDPRCPQHSVTPASASSSQTEQCRGTPLPLSKNRSWQITVALKEMCSRVHEGVGEVVWA